MIDISFGRITALALADSVNPCAIAVLTMMLIAILIKDPKNKKKLLFTGLSFIAAIYIGYMFYGIVITQFFKFLAELMREKSIYFYNTLAVIAMVIGLLNMKDFFYYKPGGIATEMPLFLRPKVKKIIRGVTSPKGAFVIGFLITLFLLPCTMGPYIVATGLLAKLGILKAFFWLIYYNILFVLPMLLIVFLIYFGFKKVEEISGWKERNIRKLHLIAGCLLFLVGLSMLLGLL